MLTWKLWSALNHPPTSHPLYRHTVQQHPIRPHFRRAWIPLAYPVLCCGFSLVWSFATQWLPLIIAVALLLGNTLYAMGWASTISALIAHQCEINIYDLLCVSPSGALVVSWVMCTGRLHRTRRFVQVHFFIRLISLIIGLTFAILLVLPLATPLVNQAANVELFTILLYALGLTAIFYIDHIQSLVLGSLAAMTAPTWKRHQTESRFRALGDFLYWQIGSYALTGIVDLVLLPIVFRLLGLTSMGAGVVLVALSVLVFYGVRERFVLLVWNRLAEQLNTDSAELDLSVLSTV